MVRPIKISSRSGGIVIRPLREFRSFLDERKVKFQVVAAFFLITISILFATQAHNRPEKRGQLPTSQPTTTNDHSGNLNYVKEEVKLSQSVVPRVLNIIC